MIWRPAELADLFRVHLQIAQSTADVRELLVDDDATRQLCRANARVWEHGGEVLAVIGIWPVWKGVGTAWTMLSSESLRHGHRLSRDVRAYLDWGSERDGYWRIQATIDQRHEAARRWLLWMGFEYEGTLRAYGPDRSTHDLYARVRL